MNISARYNLSNPQYLDANRRGEICAEQRARVEATARWWAGCAGLVVTLGVLPAILIGLIAYIVSMDVRHETPLYIFGIVVVVVGIVLLVAAVPQVLTLRRGAALRRALAAGRVESAEGQVRWDGRGYRGEAAGRRLTSPYRQLNLPPGRYRFFYLPGTDSLLSAEQIPGAEGRDNKLNLLNALASVLKFRADALEANHEGRLAASQSSTLLLALAGRLLAVPLVIGLMGVVGYFFVRDNPNGQIGVGLAVYAGAAAVVSLYLLWRSLLFGLDLAARRVAVAEGQVQRKISYSYASESGSSFSYYYALGKLKFSVSSRAHNALISGLSYRVYYAPRSRRLVAIEPV